MIGTRSVNIWNCGVWCTHQLIGSHLTNRFVHVLWLPEFTLPDERTHIVKEDAALACCSPEL